MKFLYFIVGLLTGILKFLFWGLWVEIYHIIRDGFHGLRVILDMCIKRGEKIIKGHDYD